MKSADFIQRKLQAWAHRKNITLNALEDLLPLLPAALTAIEAIQPGRVVRVEA